MKYAALRGLLALLSLGAVAAPAPAQLKPPAQVTVVTDINFPPYLFLNEDGQMQGIIKDRWELWSAHTGIPVRVEGMEWSKAQEAVLQGRSDVIEGLSYTEARTRLYEYSPPIAPVEARVYFHASISGIHDAASLKGFRVAAKSGSACGNWLAARGVKDIEGYADSAVLMRAAARGEVRLFCMDAPTAQYYLVKLGLADEFRQTAPLYATDFHWAVVKGRGELRDFLQAGYARIPPQELQAIEDRWLGTPVRFPFALRDLAVAGIVLLGLLVTGTLLLALWNRALRRQVTAKTAALEKRAAEVTDLYDNAPCGYHSLDADGVFVEVNRTELGWLGLRRDEVVGRRRFADFLDPPSRARFIERYAQFMQTGAAKDNEFGLVAADGTLRTVLVSASSVRGAGGEYLRSRATLYDITSRKQAEAAARLADERLREAIEQLDSGFSLWDKEDRLVLWNRKFRQFIAAPELLRAGLPVEELLRAVAHSGRNAAAIGREDAWVRERLAGRRLAQVQYEQLSGERWLLVNNQRLPDGMLVTNMFDITERKAAEEGLRESQRLLEAVVDAIPDSIFVKDLDSNYILANRHMANIFGMSKDELLMSHTSQLSASAEKSLRDDAWVFANRQTLDQPDALLSRPDGSLGHYHSTKIPLFDERGALTGLLGITRDITEQKRAEAALRESEQRFSALFHNSLVPQVVANPVTRETDDVNEAFVALMGYPRERLLGGAGADLALFWTPADQDAVGRAMAQGGTAALEINVRCADGTKRTVLGSAFRVGTPAGLRIAWSLVDITEQRAAQREVEELNKSLESMVQARTVELTRALEHLKSSQDALLHSEKLAALGRLVAGISHELNTPIGNSLLSASTLNERTRSFASAVGAGNLKRSTLAGYLADATEASQILLRNLEKAAQLITSFKQVAADQTSSQRRAFALREIVDEVLLAHRPMLKKSPIEVRTEVPEGIRLDSYPGPLGQVLGNLITNAVLHGYEGAPAGTVTVSARLESNDAVEIAVTDQGRGIPEGDLKRIFDPFFTTKLGRGGTGLGLGICHSIVTEALGGTIRVHSRPAHGASFTLRIPLRAPRDLQKQEAA